MNLKNYQKSLFLIGGVAIGAMAGLIFGENASVVKPIGDLFFNLLVTIVVPLVFFSIASAVAEMKSGARLGKVMGYMLGVFTFTGIIASLCMVLGVSLIPCWGQALPGVTPPDPSAGDPIGKLLVNTLTVSDFYQLLSRKSMLALIVFAVLIGSAASHLKAEGLVFRQFLQSANAVFLRMIDMVMYIAPIGLGAYMADLTGVYGPQLLGSYACWLGAFHFVAIPYFFLFFSIYAYWAGGMGSLKSFWPNVMPATFTALGTQSSMATIPVNIEAADANQVPKDISRMVIPIGATIHMDGSCLSAITKIALLHSLYGMNFFDPASIAIAVGVALLSGTVMSGIPGGGVVGEMLIVSLYGLPPEALIHIQVIAQLVDPVATVVNAIGDNVASMMVARLADGQGWKGAIPE